MHVDINLNEGALRDRLGRASTQAQIFLDNEIIKDCDPYVPMDTGMLKESAILGTVIGSGDIVYNAPYARKQYYMPGEKSKDSHPLASPQWFEKAKAVKRDAWIAGAKKIGGGG